MLSRLPLSDAPAEVPVPGETILLMDMLHSLPVTSRDIKTWTDRDPVLSRVRNLVLKGWKDTSEEDLRPYQQRRNELSVHDGCLLWGSRVIVPPAGRSRLKDELHAGHPGISKMKGLFCLVASHGPRRRRSCKTLQPMSTHSTSSICITTLTMGMA